VFAIEARVSVAESLHVEAALGVLTPIDPRS